MSNFSVELQGLRELLELTDKIAEKKRRKVALQVMRSAQDIRTNAMDKLKREKAFDLGQTHDSILAEIDEDKLLAEVGPTAPQGPYIEYGTQPHFPPIDALEGWAKRHGIPAFLVARAIASRGTFARPYLGPAYEVVAPYFDADLAKIFEEAEL